MANPIRQQIDHIFSEKAITHDQDGCQFPIITRIANQCVNPPFPSDKLVDNEAISQEMDLIQFLHSPIISKKWPTDLHRCTALCA